MPSDDLTSAEQRVLEAYDRGCGDAFFEAAGMADTAYPGSDLAKALRAAGRVTRKRLISPPSNGTGRTPAAPTVEPPCTCPFATVVDGKISAEERARSYHVWKYFAEFSIRHLIAIVGVDVVKRAHGCGDGSERDAWIDEMAKRTDVFKNTPWAMSVPTVEPARPNHLTWNGTEWVDDRCGCRYHPDDDNGSHGGAPHVHRCERHSAPTVEPPEPEESDYVDAKRPAVAEAFHELVDLDVVDLRDAVAATLHTLYNRAGLPSEPPEPDEDLPSCIEIHGDDRTGWGWDPAESTQLPCCWTRAEAEAQARAFIDSITAPHRARAEVLQAEVGPLRAEVVRLTEARDKAVSTAADGIERAVRLTRERDDARLAGRRDVLEAFGIRDDESPEEYRARILKGDGPT